MFQDMANNQIYMTISMIQDTSSLSINLELFFNNIMLYKLKGNIKTWLLI